MADDVKALTILMADDDGEDCAFVEEALRENGLPHQIRFVADGEQLLDYLFSIGKYQTRQSAPRPDLILLDLNMPSKDGRESLRLIKRDRRLHRIPVVVLTTSASQADVMLCYDLGASSYITKPATFQGWVDLVKTLNDYWFELVRLPLQE